jgi:hypothetical protein
MQVHIRRKLGMATSLRNYAQARVTGATQGYVEALAQLTERLAHAETVAQQSIAGQRAVSGAVATRKQLEAKVTDSLALLAGLAQSASHEEPNLSAGISRPDKSSSIQSFLTRGRVAAAMAVDHRELLQRMGMPDTFPEELSRLLDQYEASENEKRASRTSHVGATAELAAVTDEVMMIVRQMDALIRFRFRDDAEALAAFESARNVAWPSNDGESSGAPPESGSVKPAA